LKVYQEGRDEKPENEEDDDEEKNLPQVEQGEQLKLNKITPEQHFTEPPPRYTEATLVKRWKNKASADLRLTRRL
jgi:DNA topoisomerase-1